MAKDDDKNKPVKSNAAPVLKPDGTSQRGMAPPGAVGNDRFTVVGPVFLGYKTNEDPFGLHRSGGGSGGGDRPAPDQRYETTPRFHETEDQDINRLYGRDHIMVRTDGTEMLPHEWDDEKEQQQDQGSLDLEPEQDRPSAEVESGEHPAQTAPGHDDGVDLELDDPDDDLPRR